MKRTELQIKTYLSTFHGNSLSLQLQQEIRKLKTMGFLTQDQIDFYHQNGYLVIPNYLDNDTVQNMRRRMSEIVDNFDPVSSQSIFTTKEQTRKSDQYFLNSSYDIRFFWEEKAWDNGNLTVSSPILGLNKVGHALHDLDSLFESVSYDTRIGSACRQLGMKRPLAAQSMYIFKQPRVGGEVCPHQDGTFLYTEPQTCIGFWWALDNCSTSNGCLWAVPGSHRLGVERHFRRKAEDYDQIEFFPPEPEKWDLTGAVPVDVSAGSLVLLHYALVHYSADNLSDQPRHSYAVHTVDGDESVSYLPDNWLQRPVDHPFRVIPGEL